MKKLCRWLAGEVSCCSILVYELAQDTLRRGSENMSDAVRDCDSICLHQSKGRNDVRFRVPTLE